MPLGEFVRRFNVVVPPDALPASLLTGLNNSTASEKQAAEILLLHIDMERSSYRLGLSQVIFLFSFLFTDVLMARKKETKLNACQMKGQSIVIVQSHVRWLSPIHSV